jgi:hypothetical protein
MPDNSATTDFVPIGEGRGRTKAPIAIMATRAEQAIRPAVVNRKVWGGNRTWLGAASQGILTSVLQTCEQRELMPYDFLCQAILGPQLLPA